MKKTNINAAVATALVVMAAGIGSVHAHTEQAEAHGFYVVECHDAEGNLKWVDTIDNLVTTVGKNFALDTYLAGSGYTATWFLGLVDGAATPTFAAGDTMASHAGWTENQNYSNSTRIAAAWASASAGAKALSAGVVFNINAATQTIAGCFLTTVSTKGGTTGTLYSCGAFSGGNKSVTTGETLTVTYTASL